VLSNSITLIGYSGHGIVVAEAAIQAGMSLQYYAEISEKPINPFGLEYKGYDQDPDFLKTTENSSYILGIGDNSIRKEVALKLLAKKCKIENVIHPDSSLSEYITYGKGNFFARNVSVNPMVEIGNFCILNTAATIEHDCKIADNVHIAPGAILTGNVHIGCNSLIGAGAVIKPGVKIGENVIIGAGTVVLRDVPDGYKIVGNPGRKI
jgi:sugar O-acyltransferase (sialic acid O-acetyltransferase NeuD family)